MIWLLELVIGGTVIRAAQRPVTTADGVVFSGGLGAVSVSRSAQDGPSGRSIALSVQGPDWTAHVAGGDALPGATATLYRWREGQTLAQCSRRIEGLVEEPETGTRFDALTFSLTTRPWGDGTRLIPASYAVDRDTWPSRSASTYEPDPQIFGTLPALVVGHVGDVYFAGTSVVAPSDTAVQGPPLYPLSLAKSWAELGGGVPGLLVEYGYVGGASRFSSRIAFASHQVDATKCVIWNRSAKRWDLATVGHMQDARGQVVAYADPDGGFMPIAMGDEYWILLLEDYGGGLRAGGGPVETLGELLSWMLARMQIPISLSEQRGAGHLLDGYTVQFATNTDATVWDWIRQEILGTYPVRFVEHNDGGWLAPYPQAPTAADVVDTIDTEAEDVAVVSTVKWDSSEVANEITVRFAPGEDGFQKVATLTATTDTTRSQRADDRCIASQAKWGVRSRTWDVATTADDETAWKIARGLVAEYAGARADIFVESGRRFEGRQLLDVVRLNAPTYGLNNVLGVVEQIDESDDRIILGIRIREVA